MMPSKVRSILTRYGLDSEVAVDNGVQPRLDKAAVQDEAEGLKTPEERLQTPPNRGGKGE